jgi:hypothetical protein
VLGSKKFSEPTGKSIRQFQETEFGSQRLENFPCRDFGKLTNDYKKLERPVTRGDKSSLRVTEPNTARITNSSKSSPGYDDYPPLVIMETPKARNEQTLDIKCEAYPATVSYLQTDDSNFNTNDDSSRFNFQLLKKIELEPPVQQHYKKILPESPSQDQLDDSDSENFKSQRAQWGRGQLKDLVDRGLILSYDNDSSELTIPAQNPDPQNILPHNPKTPSPNHQDVTLPSKFKVTKFDTNYTYSPRDDPRRILNQTNKTNNRYMLNTSDDDPCSMFASDTKCQNNQNLLISEMQIILADQKNANQKNANQKNANHRVYKATSTVADSKLGNFFDTKENFNPNIAGLLGRREGFNAFCGKDGNEV